ncbi:MAG: protease [Bdellovibrionales bacterium RBG_16_40_8]|nr:MAG: protease [Bdellovibrionales bacterium RBG_16_40_8]
MKIFFALIVNISISAAYAANSTGDFLVKFSPDKLASYRGTMLNALPSDAKVEDLELAGWHRIQLPKSKLHSLSMHINALSKMPGVLYVQPNYKIRLLEQPGMAELRAKVKDYTSKNFEIADSDGAISETPSVPKIDNPAIPPRNNPGRGEDPLLDQQWGMLDIGASRAWDKSPSTNNVIVAVIDTGVDYQHEDLVDNLWRNSGETGTDSQGRDKSTNDIDDDGNGYIDDVIGWDFVANDNKPYDLASEPIELIMGGGNPGHGTHCAGNVAGRGQNGKGISGVAPNASIMVLRFISQKGEGTTADAVKSLKYAIQNGAKITSNSWGSEGDDPNESNENRALHEAIQECQANGVLFIAAAGNGHQGVGYDNDSDPKPGVPASYNDDIIISVAAIDSNNQLGSFSNWGKNSVDIAAPGVNVFSTTVGSNYSDVVLDLFGIKVTWDGTSMATPHVAGAAALYLSQNPGATWMQVKEALLKSATPLSDLTGKLVSSGKLNVDRLVNTQ